MRAEQDVFIWVVLRLSKGTQLNITQEAGRTAWTVAEWYLFVSCVSFPSVQQRLTSVHMCDLDDDGRVIVCFPPMPLVSITATAE
jgi:hypothetical protein